MTELETLYCQRKAARRELAKARERVRELETRLAHLLVENAELRDQLGLSAPASQAQTMPRAPGCGAAN